MFGRRRGVLSLLSLIYILWGEVRAGFVLLAGADPEAAPAASFWQSNKESFVLVSNMT